MTVSNKLPSTCGSNVWCLAYIYHKFKPNTGKYSSPSAHLGGMKWVGLCSGSDIPGCFQSLGRQVGIHGWKWGDFDSFIDGHGLHPFVCSQAIVLLCVVFFSDCFITTCFLGVPISYLESQPIPLASRIPTFLRYVCFELYQHRTWKSIWIGCQWLATGTLPATWQWDWEGKVNHEFFVVVSLNGTCWVEVGWK